MYATKMRTITTKSIKSILDKKLYLSHSAIAFETIPGVGDDLKILFERKECP